MTAVVKPVGKEHGVYIGEWLLGTTKLQCDAQMHANKINESRLTPRPCSGNTVLDFDGEIEFLKQVEAGWPKKPESM